VKVCEDELQTCYLNLTMIQWLTSPDCSFTGTIWMYARKRKLWCEGHFSHLRRCFGNSNEQNVWKWVPNLVLILHNNSMTTEFETVILLRHVWVYARKRENFGRGRRKNKIKRKRNHKDLKTDLTCLYL